MLSAVTLRPNSWIQYSDTHLILQTVYIRSRYKQLYLHRHFENFLWICLIRHVTELYPVLVRCLRCAFSVRTLGPNLVFFGVITFLFIYPLFLPEADSFEHFMTCSKFMLTCVPLWNRENKLFMDTSYIIWKFTKYLGPTKTIYSMQKSHTLGDLFVLLWEVSL